jgi:hypothetical protein
MRSARLPKYLLANGYLPIHSIQIVLKTPMIRSNDVTGISFSIPPRHDGDEGCLQMSCANVVLGMNREAENRNRNNFTTTSIVVRSLMQ